MSPRSGGDSDKFGNRYEGRWTIHQLLKILVAEAEAITVEPLGEIGEGVEFILERSMAPNEVHQVKRQTGVADEWELSKLHARKVLGHAKRQVDAGRQFHFVSITPARLLHELADRARQTSDLHRFRDHMLTSKDLTTGFAYLGGRVYDSEETAWRTLRGLYVAWTMEEFLQSQNEVLAGLLLAGAKPRLITAGLGDLIANNTTIRLDAAKIDELLATYGLSRRADVTDEATVERVSKITDNWRASVGAGLLQPVIPRAESGQLVEGLRFGEDRVLFVVGTAGSGKSAVLHEAMTQIAAEDWSVLAFRLDRLGSFATSADLGRLLSLGQAPVAALASVAQGRSSLLLIDQLDAVSLAAGRMPQSFELIADLVRQAAAFPQMRVVLACRQFDLENDERIRTMASQQGVVRVDVAPLSNEQVDAAVTAMGLAADGLTDNQRELLGMPLHLVLLRTIADQPSPLSFESGLELFDAYWDRKLQDCETRRPGVRFAETIGLVAETMSERQRLTVARTILDQNEFQVDGRVLISNGILIADGRKLAFFHEAFFDYAFARHWTNRGQTLVAFLQGSEQKLFRRSQVRQILAHLRDADFERYLTELEVLLTDPAIRFHIKDSAFAFLGSLSDPASAEWEIAARLLASDPAAGDRVWLTIRTLPWFNRLDGEGLIEAWLGSGDEAEQRQALDMMVPAAKSHPDRLAELLAPCARKHTAYVSWLAWATRFANLYESRPLFELVLDAVRRGDYAGKEPALWLACHGLGQQRPSWAVELLRAYLVDRPGALEISASGQIVALESDEHGLLEMANQSASAACEAFCQSLLPYLLQVMQITENDPTHRPVTDRHFSYRDPGLGVLYRLDDALLRGAVSALRSLASSNPEAAQPLLETLAADPHDTAQWLLYEVLRSDGQRYATWAGQLLLEGDYRLVSGYGSSAAWTVRQLLEAVWPYLDAGARAALEQAILARRPPGTSDKTTKWIAFTLLSGLPDDDLSTDAQQRLAELRAELRVDQPPEPIGIKTGFIESPIPPEAMTAMSDEQWLQAMAKYSTDDSDLTFFTGGARQLSQVLQTNVTAEPERFARLALRLTSDLNPSYGTAVLHALADIKLTIEPGLVFDVIRHIASLGHEEYQDWLGWPLRRYRDEDIPDDVLEIILDRALHATSPTADDWLQTDTHEAYYGGDIYASGMNSARGQSALVLGDLLLHDADGHRTALVVPSLHHLTQDPVVAVRSCVGHLLLGCLQHARAEATAAFWQLIKADDRLLATKPVLDLMTYISADDPSAIEPIIKRMLDSEHPTARHSGAIMAAFAGLELGLDELLTTARKSADESVRKGAAEICAQRLIRTVDPVSAAAALRQFFSDPDDDVRQAAAEVAGTLRGQALRPSTPLLNDLMDSPSYTAALPQLLMTMKQAPDRIDELVIHCARRFLNEYGGQVGDLSTAAAGQVQDIGRLVVRAYAQAATTAGRATVLDLIDELLLRGAYDFARIIDEAVR